LFHFNAIGFAAISSRTNSRRTVATTTCIEVRLDWMEGPTFDVASHVWHILWLDQLYDLARSNENSALQQSMSLWLV
jgi:hypothetical protein